MKTRHILASIALALGMASTHASNITVDTGFFATTAQGSAAAYQSVVETAVAVPAVGYGSTSISLYDNISNHGLFGSSSNIAFKSTIDFGATAGNAGAWDFRFGVDFGGGGAVFLDGVALAFNSNDMWWNGSYSNPSQYLSFSSSIGAGNHQLLVYGLEGCCDGNQQAQFRAPGADWVTFGANDGLNVAAIPEPETYAMLLAGLGIMGAMARRRKQSI